MEKKILKELLKRPGMSEQDWELLEDMIHDSIIDMRSYLNYEDEESLPERSEEHTSELQSLV